MNKEYVGNQFYALMDELGENYTLTKKDGTTYTGKIALKANTKSSYMISEREYLFFGQATFPDMASQTTFRGCYFHREINPEKKYILVSTIPEPTNPQLATIYAIQCNTKVDLAYVVEDYDDRLNRVLKPVKYAYNVDVFADSTLQRQLRKSDANFESTLFFMQMPADIGLSLDQIVFRKSYEFNEETKENEFVDVKYRVESIDLAMTTHDEEGHVYGIMDVQMSKDTRFSD